MIPMRAEYGAEFSKSVVTGEGQAAKRPTLVLCDTAQEQPLRQPAAARSARPRSRAARHQALLGITLALGLLIIVGAGVQSTWQNAVAHYAQQQTPPTVVQVHVGQGDTLWRYAARYGDPSAYILDRVQAIAQDNHLTANAPLVPGQTLRITVQNPRVLAALHTAKHSRLASAAVRQ